MGSSPRPRRKPRDLFEDSPTFRAIRALEGVRRTGVALAPFLAELEKRSVIGYAGDGQRVFWAKDAAKLILEIAAQVEPIILATLSTAIAQAEPTRPTARTMANHASFKILPSSDFQLSPRTYFQFFEGKCRGTNKKRLVLASRFKYFINKTYAGQKSCSISAFKH